jgi:hypothetical protein
MDADVKWFLIHQQGRNVNWFLDYVPISLPSPLFFQFWKHVEISNEK